MSSALTSSSGSPTSSRDIGSAHLTQTPDDDPVSLEARRWIVLVFSVFSCGAIGLFGSVANVINIAVFLTQGCNDSVTVSFLGLTVSDLISLLGLVWTSICFNPWFEDSNIPFDSFEILYLTSGMPRVCLARITCWVTAFITFERCLCIAIPLKVKAIMNTSRTAVIIIIIYGVMIGSVFPLFIYRGFGPKFFYKRNKTLIGLVYYNQKFNEHAEGVSFSLTAFSMVSSFVIVSVCTVILIHNLIRSSQWRRSLTGGSVSGLSDDITTRDRRVARTVAAMSTIFIICYLPSTLNIAMMALFSNKYSLTGAYESTLQVTWSIFLVLEAINSSVNIVVYYTTSSKYRAAFKQLFDKLTCKFQKVSQFT